MPFVALALLIFSFITGLFGVIGGNSGGSETLVAQVSFQLVFWALLLAATALLVRGAIYPSRKPLDNEPSNI